MWPMSWAEKFPARRTTTSSPILMANVPLKKTDPHVTFPMPTEEPGSLMSTAPGSVVVSSTPSDLMLNFVPPIRRPTIRWYFLSLKGVCEDWSVVMPASPS